MKELIVGFQILDLNDHFSASLRGPGACSPEKLKRLCSGLAEIASAGH